VGSPVDLYSAAAAGGGLVLVAAAVLVGRRAVCRVAAAELHPEDVPTARERAGQPYEEGE
jgi:hypothetical protein